MRRGGLRHHHSSALCAAAVIIVIRQRGCAGAKSCDRLVAPRRELGDTPPSPPRLPPPLLHPAPLHPPPLPDGSGGFFYISPPKTLKDVGPKAVSAVRRDLMTSIVAVGRELVSASPRVVLGHGQGGFVAALAAFPRILESALAIVYAREPEGVQIAEAWRNVRIFIAISLRLHAVSSVELLERPFRSSEECNSAAKPPPPSSWSGG